MAADGLTGARGGRGPGWRVRVAGLLALGLAGLLAGGDAGADAKKLKLGVLKLSSSAPIFVGVEKGYFASTDSLSEAGGRSRPCSTRS